MKENLTFQVNTCGSPEIKKFLIDLYEKYVEKANYHSYKANEYIYLQFWIGENRQCSGVSHDITPYKESLYPVVSVQEAVRSLTTYVKEVPYVPIKVLLNERHIAEVQKNGDVQVGCQIFKGEVIRELAKQSLENWTKHQLD